MLCISQLACRVFCRTLRAAYLCRTSGIPLWLSILIAVVSVCRLSVSHPADASLILILRLTLILLRYRTGSHRPGYRANGILDGPTNARGSLVVDRLAVLVVNRIGHLGSLEAEANQRVGLRARVERTSAAIMGNQ